MTISEPKIVLFDLEIIPDLQQALKYWTMLNASWDSSMTLKAEVTSICSFGFEIFGDNRAQVKNAWDWPEWDKNVNADKKLCKFAYDLLVDADAVVYHNGDGFDLKYLNTRLAIHKLPQLPNIPTIDTKKLLKRHFFLLRNSLGHGSEIVTDAEKMDHGEGWQLWIDTVNRKKKAMKLMSEYCKQDIVATRELFKVLRPKIRNIPNYNHHSKGLNVCPNCGSTRLKSHGWRNTKTMTYKRYRCIDCAAFSRTNQSDKMPRSF